MSDIADENLVALIQENSNLPAAALRRFNRLRRKRQEGTLTKSEEIQLRDLWRQVEQVNATRLKALGELARRHGTTLKTAMRQLGLRENRDVF